MNKTQYLPITLITLLIGGCTSTPYTGDDPKPLTIREADQSMVKDCKFLGTVSRSSITTLGGTGLGYAIKSAQDKGASHYVIASSTSGISGGGFGRFGGVGKLGRSSVMAYKCKGFKTSIHNPTYIQKEL